MSKTSRRPTGAGTDGTARRGESTAAGSRIASGTPRAGRREQRRPRYDDRSFLERYRTPILGVGMFAVVALVVGFVFFGATSKTYACTSMFDPSPTPAPSAGASPRAGYVEPDMGRNHVTPGAQTSRYAYCPPASGPHYNAGGRGPIPARFYGPDAGTEPQGWIHNLEHGGFVLLYNCTNGCSEDLQAQLRAFVSSFPASPVCNIAPGQISPVVARFDDMKWPFAALVWGRVLPLQALDTQAALDFFKTEGERTNPEKQCAAPSPSPEPSPSAAPSASPSASPSAAASPAASTEPSPSPSPS